MNAHGYLHHTSDTGIVVTVSTVGVEDTRYALTWRCGPKVCDVSVVEIVTEGKEQHFRTSLNSWRLT